MTKRMYQRLKMTSNWKNRWKKEFVPETIANLGNKWSTDTSREPRNIKKLYATQYDPYDVCGSFPWCTEFAEVHQFCRCVLMLHWCEPTFFHESRFASILPKSSYYKLAHKLKYALICADFKGKYLHTSLHRCIFNSKIL